MINVFFYTDTLSKHRAECVQQHGMRLVTMVTRVHNLSPYSPYMNSWIFVNKRSH